MDEEQQVGGENLVSDEQERQDLVEEASQWVLVREVFGSNSAYWFNVNTFETAWQLPVRLPTPERERAQAAQSQETGSSKGVSSHGRISVAMRTESTYTDDSGGSMHILDFGALVDRALEHRQRAAAGEVNHDHRRAGAHIARSSTSPSQRRRRSSSRSPHGSQRRSSTSSSSRRRKRHSLHSARSSSTRGVALPVNSAVRRGEVGEEDDSVPPPPPPLLEHQQQQQQHDGQAAGLVPVLAVDAEPATDEAVALARRRAMGGLPRTSTRSVKPQRKPPPPPPQLIPKDALGGVRAKERSRREMVTPVATAVLHAHLHDDTMPSPRPLSLRQNRGRSSSSSRRRRRDSASEAARLADLQRQPSDLSLPPSRPPSEAVELDPPIDDTEQAQRPPSNGSIARRRVAAMTKRSSSNNLTRRILEMKGLLPPSSEALGVPPVPDDEDGIDGHTTTPGRSDAGTVLLLDDSEDAGDAAAAMPPDSEPAGASEESAPSLLLREPSSQMRTAFAPSPVRRRPTRPHGPSESRRPTTDMLTYEDQDASMGPPLRPPDRRRFAGNWSRWMESRVQEPDKAWVTKLDSRSRRWYRVNLNTHAIVWMEDGPLVQHTVEQEDERVGGQASAAEQPDYEAILQQSLRESDTTGVRVRHRSRSSSRPRPSSSRTAAPGSSSGRRLSPGSSRGTTAQQAGSVRPTGRSRRPQSVSMHAWAVPGFADDVDGSQGGGQGESASLPPAYDGLVSIVVDMCGVGGTGGTAGFKVAYMLDVSKTRVKDILRLVSRDLVAEVGDEAAKWPIALFIGSNRLDDAVLMHELLGAQVVPPSMDQDTLEVIATEIVFRCYRVPDEQAAAFVASTTIDGRGVRTDVLVTMEHNPSELVLVQAFASTPVSEVGDAALQMLRESPEGDSATVLLQYPLHRLVYQSDGVQLVPERSLSANGVSSGVSLPTIQISAPPQ